MLLPSTRAIVRPKVDTSHSSASGRMISRQMRCQKGGLKC